MSDDFLSWFVALAIILSTMVIIFVLAGGMEIIDPPTEKECGCKE